MHVPTVFASTILALVASGRTIELVQARDQHDLSSAIESLTSIVGSAYSHATAEAASYYSDGLSAASVGIQQGLSDASTYLAAHSAVFTAVTSIGGAAESIVTSVSGPAITLAASGGVVTSFAGSEYTVFASPTSTANGAMTVHSTLTTSPMLAMLITVVGGTLIGAWLTC